MNLFTLLDELRIIAQNGLEYADNHHDRERYDRILELVTTYYGMSFDLPSEEVRERFAEDVGYITPKLSAGAAIFDSDGQILLMKRTDNESWCLQVDMLIQMKRLPPPPLARRMRKQGFV